MVRVLCPEDAAGAGCAMPTGTPHRLRFLLGLPSLVENDLWRTAVRLDAPVLVSANALSRWRLDGLGVRTWRGFHGRNLNLVRQHPVCLDSAGFVAASRYNGFPWDVGDYLDLCAAAPWHWFASMDWCVEPEVAADEPAVLDRISGTVRLNVLCSNGAEVRGIADRFMPVIQGWRVDHYLRCLDRMPFALDYPLVGVGSMCRRHVNGDAGVIRVIDELDRSLGSSPARLHLFGLKSEAMAELRGHPRVQSCDSQAYGVAARQHAWSHRQPKTNSTLAAAMAWWLEKQRRAVDEPGYRFRRPVTRLTDEKQVPSNPIEAQVAQAAERLRDLHEAGEIDWSDVSPLAAYEMAFMD